MERVEMNMSEHIRYTVGRSSLGDFVVAASDQGVTALEFVESGGSPADALRHRYPDAVLEEDSAGLFETAEQLASMMEHPEQRPDVSLDIRGSDYEKRVWDLLRGIPAGETVSYGEIAARLGNPREAREVAEACAANPIAVLTPCHRVVKKDGSLSGYRWGFKRKRELLARERNAALQPV
jgi:AraC family transcriptional regulator, regulatory protein of adaptative response / methylated-DNA-[protein]-cysteine methyltransferase